MRKEIENIIRDSKPTTNISIDFCVRDICSLIVERLEKITDGYQITKTQAKVNALIKEIKGE